MAGTDSGRLLLRTMDSTLKMIALKDMQSDDLLEIKEYALNCYYRGPRDLAIVDAFMIVQGTLHLIQVTIGHRKEFPRLEDIGNSPGLEGLVSNILDKTVKKTGTADGKIDNMAVKVISFVQDVAFHYVECKSGRLDVVLAGPKRINVADKKDPEQWITVPAVPQLPEKVCGLKLTVDILTLDDKVLYPMLIPQSKTPTK